MVRVKLQEVAPAYIDPKKLTYKERRWLTRLIETKKPTQSAWDVYECKNRNVAKCIAHQNMRKMGIVLTDFLDMMGLTLEKDVEDLKRLRRAKTTKHFAHEGRIISKAVHEDNKTQLEALKLTMQLRGKLNQSTINIDNSQHTHYTYVWKDENDLHPVQPSRLPAGSSLQ